MDDNGSNTEVQRSNSGGSDLHYLTRIDPLNYSREQVERLWTDLHKFPWAFSDTTRNRGDIFATSLFMPNTEHYKFGEDGYLAVHSIEHQGNATIHWAVWNKVSAHQILGAAKELLTHLFRTHKLERVTAAVPVYNKQAIRFNTLLGFKYEGEIRRGVLMDGKYHNVTIYGLLRKEFYAKEVEQ